MARMISTHIDNVKGGATSAERKVLLPILKKHYGDDAKVETRKFGHIGIQREPDPHIGSVYMHQDHYVL
eukprot:2637754-Prorocentrum_lima.AAC.1